MMRLALGTVRFALAALISVSVSGAAIGNATLASFTAETISPGNIFETGTLDLQSFFMGSQPGQTANGSGLFAVGTNAAPGQTAVAGPQGGLLAPGTILQNTLTLQNAGTIPADRLKFYLTGAFVRNQPDTACDASNAAGSTDGCGRGRLANVLELMIYYPVPGDTTERQFVCVYPVPAAGRMVAVGSRADLVDPARGGCGFGPLVNPVPPFAPSPATPGETTPVDVRSYLLPALAVDGILVPGFNAAPAGLRPGQCLSPPTDQAGTCARALWEAGEQRPLTLAVRLSDGPAVNNDYQGASATFDFKWQAEAGR